MLLVCRLLYDTLFCVRHEVRSCCDGIMLALRYGPGTSVHTCTCILMTAESDSELLSLALRNKNNEFYVMCVLYALKYIGTGDIF